MCQISTTSRLVSANRRVTTVWYHQPSNGSCQVTCYLVSNSLQEKKTSISFFVHGFDTLVFILICWFICSLYLNYFGDECFFVRRFHRIVSYVQPFF